MEPAPRVPRSNRRLPSWLLAVIVVYALLALWIVQHDALSIFLEPAHDASSMATKKTVFRPKKGQTNPQNIASLNTLLNRLDVFMQSVRETLSSVQATLEASDKVLAAYSESQQRNDPLSNSAEKRVHPQNKKSPRKRNTKSSSGSYYANIGQNTVIIVLCYNRVPYLEKTLNALISIPGIEDFSIVISQDGTDASVGRFAREFVASQRGLGLDVSHVQHTDRPAWASSGTEFLAAHYKRILDSSFFDPELDDRYDYAIMVEDDLVLSHDVLHLFDIAAPFLLDEEERAWCVSSWNDNGFGDVFDLRSDRLMRTDFFPGLGWMLHRNLWAELTSKWPRNHWDHWMRADAQHQGRSCIIPEVSRNFNIGEEGAHVSSAEYRKFLSRVAFYDSKEFADFGDLDYLHYETYLEESKALLERGLENDASVKVELYTRQSYSILQHRYNIYDYARSHFHSMIPLRPKASPGSTVLLVDQKRCDLFPDGSPFRISPRKDSKLRIGAMGESCDLVCKKQSLACADSELEFLNYCSELKKYFPCEKGCSKEWGPDIPNYVPSVSNKYNGWCLVTEMVSTCDGRHADTARLCPCVPA
eukprot:ANDGO_01658.mRNA.1 hypothetical protein